MYLEYIVFVVELADEIVVLLENAITSADIQLLESAIAKYNSSHLPSSDDKYAHSVALQAEELLELLQCRKGEHIGHVYFPVMNILNPYPDPNLTVFPDLSDFSFQIY